MTNTKKGGIMETGNKPCESCEKNNKPNCENSFCYTNRKIESGAKDCKRNLNIKDGQTEQK